MFVLEIFNCFSFNLFINYKNCLKIKPMPNFALSYIY